MKVAVGHTTRYASATTPPAVDAGAVMVFTGPRNNRKATQTHGHKRHRLFLSLISAKSWADDESTISATSPLSIGDRPLAGVEGDSALLDGDTEGRAFGAVAGKVAR